MVGDVTLAGFYLTHEEWEGLDAESRRLLLRICAETHPARSEDSPYEQYVIEWE